VYLANHIGNLRAILGVYGDLLELLLADVSFPLSQVAVIDYGGGSGVLSLFAKELGIGTVIYQDIYDVSCKDAMILANFLGRPLDHIVCGDVEDLVHYVRVNSIDVTGVVSFDVLEHIYDIESHFAHLAHLSAQPFRVVYGSGANISNPVYVFQVKRKQRAAELTERKPATDHKGRDALGAYLTIRKNIVSNYAPSLGPGDVEFLARATRGLKQQDIMRGVDEFIETGKISYHIDHPTNTCDPFTGNWCEHLIKKGWLRDTVVKAGFRTEILAGFYQTPGSLIKRAIAPLFNLAIRLSGRRVMFLAPYYVLKAAR